MITQKQYLTRKITKRDKQQCAIHSVSISYFKIDKMKQIERTEIYKKESGFNYLEDGDSWAFDDGVWHFDGDLWYYPN